MSDHSSFGPSTLQRRWLCPGSWILERDLPEEPEGPDALAGKAAHKALETGVRTGDWTALRAMEGLEDLEDLCQSLKALWADAEVLCEHRVDLSHIDPVMGFGTLDLAFVRPFEEGCLIDLKSLFGWHPKADENLQLTAYALGLAREFALSAVDLLLWQPRLQRYTSARLDSADMERATGFLRAIVTRAQRPLPAQEFRAGRHCEHCRAALTCPALAAAREWATRQQQSVEAPVADPQTVGGWLDQAEGLEAWLGAVRGRAYSLLMGGARIPGWCLREGRGTRDWTAPAEQVEEFLTQHGKDPEEAWLQELKSPAQIEKIVGKSKPVAAAMSQLWAKKPGALKLARESAKETE